MHETHAFKTCSACGRSKPLDQFYRNRSKPDGRVHLCKPCWSQYQKERRLTRRYLDALDAAPPPIPGDMKRCSSCRRILPLESFRPNASKPMGRAAYCLECDPQVNGLATARRLIRTLVEILSDEELTLERRRFQRKSRRLHHGRAECAVLNCRKPGLYHQLNYIDPEAVAPLCEDHHLDVHRFERLLRKVARLLGIHLDDFVHMDVESDEPEPAFPAPPHRRRGAFRDFDPDTPCGLSAVTG